jgi:hypothetical protein
VKPETKALMRAWLDSLTPPDAKGFTTAELAEGWGCTTDHAKRMRIKLMAAGKLRQTGLRQTVRADGRKVRIPVYDEAVPCPARPRRANG